MRLFMKKGGGEWVEVTWRQTPFVNELYALSTGTPCKLESSWQAQLGTVSGPIEFEVRSSDQASKVVFTGRIKKDTHLKDVRLIYFEETGAIQFDCPVR